jgi:hypothetical protein
MRALRLLLPVAVVIAVLLPQQSHAMQQYSFQFAQGSVNATWRGTGPIAMSQLSDAITLSTTSGTGMFLVTDDLPFLAFFVIGIPFIFRMHDNVFVSKFCFRSRCSYYERAVFQIIKFFNAFFVFCFQIGEGICWRPGSRGVA